MSKQRYNFLAALFALFKLDNPEQVKTQTLRECFSSLGATLMHRHIIGLFFANSITFIIMYGAFLTYYPLLLKSSFGFSPLYIGLVLSLMSLSNAAAHSLSFVIIITQIFLFYSLGFQGAFKIIRRVQLW